jgi:hypothetical protein
MAPPLTAQLAGGNLLTNRGDIIGYIVTVRRHSLVVQPGNNFRASPKAVVVPQDYVYITDGVVRTRMTAAQLASMPPYLPRAAANDMSNMRINPQNGRP